MSKNQNLTTEIPAEEQIITEEVVIDKKALLLEKTKIVARKLTKPAIIVAAATATFMLGAKWQHARENEVEYEETPELEYDYSDDHSTPVTEEEFAD